MRKGRKHYSAAQREPGVAAELAADHALFQLPAGDPASDHTTNSLESLNRSLRKIIKTRGGFSKKKRR